MRLSDFRKATQHLSDATVVIGTQDGSRLSVDAVVTESYMVNGEQKVEVVLDCSAAIDIKEIS